MGTSDVLVVGGGLIGLGIAWRAAGRGLAITLVDPAPGSGASYAAAGMLAPVTEAHYGEEDLTSLNLDSSLRYPAFITAVETATGLPTGYRPCGTLAVALDADDQAALDEIGAFQRSLGLAAERISGRECRRLEPLLAPAVRGGWLVAGDHQVDNRLLTRALLAAAEGAGVAVRRERVAELLLRAGRAAGVRLAGGEVLEAEQIVLAAGAWSRTLPGLPPEAAPPVRPVKGQTLRLRAAGPYLPFLRRNVRGLVHGSPVYLVPREDGEVVIGATQEELGYDTQVTAGGVYELLRDARLIVPAVTELALEQTYAGLRPGSPDNAPIIGPTALPGLIVATGHHRHGVMLTPVTADTVAELLATGTVPDLIAPFAPSRFEGVPA